jgi:site-specific DNA recombinase
MTKDEEGARHDLARTSSVAPKLSFAFYGRVSTEDNQDPESSLNWQLSRAHNLITLRGGLIVAQFFDVGQTRALPWPRRPDASRLLAALRDRQRGFDAVVIGEPHRAFYGNQFSLTLPVLTHYGVQLWVPEVGGPIDPPYGYMLKDVGPHPNPAKAADGKRLYKETLIKPLDA